MFLSFSNALTVVVKMFLFKKSAISDKVRCLRKEPSAEWSIEVLLLKMGKPSGGGKGEDHQGEE